MVTTCHFVKQILISSMNRHETQPTRQPRNSKPTSADDRHLM